MQASSLKWMMEKDISLMRYKEGRTIPEWISDSGIMLPSNSTEPGLWRIDRAPYQKAILDALSPQGQAREVYLVFGSQMGKTTIENGVMAYYMDEDPAPIGFAFSDDGSLKDYIRFKFDPFLSANPRIKGLLRSEGTGRADSMSAKQFPGGFLKFMSGKSPSDMASNTIRIIMMDEVERMGITKEGDPRDLLRRRMNNFESDTKMCISSTPTNKGIIWNYLRESTYRKYFVPCPHCGYRFPFELEWLRWKIRDGSDGVVEDAWFECPECRRQISETNKAKMLEKGEWIVTNPDADPEKDGYWLPSFNAPQGWISWKKIAQEYTEACMTSQGLIPERMTAFYNTVLAMPYEPGTGDQDWRRIYADSQKSDIRRGEVPSDVCFLTTGGDIQKNRIEVSLFGWSMMGRHYAIDHIIIPVSEDDPLSNPYSESWKLYHDYIFGTFVREDGIEIMTAANALDSSYRPEDVYGFNAGLTAFEQTKFFPVKGQIRESESGELPIPVKRFGHRSMQTAFWAVPTSKIKQRIFEHLSPEKPDNSPFKPIFPLGYDETYFQQLCSERFVQKSRGRWEWEKIRDRNEVLDCRVYNYAMFYLLGLHSFTPEAWKELSTALKTNAASESKSGWRVLSSGVKV